ncbi:TIR domain-containing protein [Ferruginibacter sp. SUN002]|uniref:TIR domain-containing protein n=1 Tax=Ferruginibacter sp. SUN002 TaxID=2937789 RepID=UPI003D36F495
MEIAITKLKGLLSELNLITGATDADRKKFDRIVERTKGIATRQFTPTQTYSEKIEVLSERISRAVFGLNHYHVNDLVSIIEVMIDELDLLQHQEQKVLTNFENITPLNSYNPAKSAKNNSRIFIVHGHNDAMKFATARTLEKFKLEPIILHEQANNGDTIIEKFTRNSDVGFAIILLSADDYGYSKKDSSANAKLRARQNVIFELGFFYGKLERKKVVAIFEQTDDFEKPSDIDGIVYIPYNPNDSGWQFELAKELKGAGYQIDTNVLIH